MAFQNISASEVDAKSPLDDGLFGKIKNNFDYLNGALTGGKAYASWEIAGPTRRLVVYRRQLGPSLSFDSFTPSVCRVNLKRGGISGVLNLDIRVLTNLTSLGGTAITGIDHQYDAATSTIANIAPAHATQSITRTTAQISTQSISVAKPTLSISSIVQVEGTNKWRLNTTTAPDADWIAALAKGASVLVASATSGGNNGTFVMAEINQSGAPSVVVTNASGVAQLAAAGTIQLQLFSYNQTNPVSAEFVADESALFASHTTGANNGTFPIFKVNQAGNNIWVLNATGAVQAAAAGNVNVQRFQYNFSGAASATDFIIGEKAKMASHSTGANNGNFPITGVNVGGNNVQVYNSAGVVQGGVAGNVNTNRWIYSLPTDPSSQISVGSGLQLEGHTNALNNGYFTAKEVKRSGLNNVVVYNESGVAQGSAAGNTRTSRKLIKFATDQSSKFTLLSSVDLAGTISGLYLPAVSRAPFDVLEINRGGGANYNIVIDNYGAPSQSSPAGVVETEYKSIFSVKPSIAAVLVGNTPARDLYGEFTNFVGGALAGGAKLALFCTSMQVGDTRDLNVTLQ